MLTDEKILEIFELNKDKRGNVLAIAFARDIEAACKKKLQPIKSEPKYYFEVVPVSCKKDMPR